MRDAQVFYTKTATKRRRSILNATLFRHFAHKAQKHYPKINLFYANIYAFIIRGLNYETHYQNSLSNIVICSLSLCFTNSLFPENACGANVTGHQTKIDEEKKLLSRLMHAAQTGDSRKIEDILQSGFNVNTTDENGRTALMIASALNTYYRYPIGTLLRHGADVNMQDKNGVSALMYAASENGSAALVNHLLINNATAELQR